jgi:hypothetical protein
VAVSKRDRARFEAIGEALAAARHADFVEATISTPAERVRTGFVLGDVPRTAAIDAAMDADALGQIGLAQRRPVRRQ